MPLNRIALEGAHCYTKDMTWSDEGRIPRFHPLIAVHNGLEAWWIADGHADTEHNLAMPYLEEPCVDREDALTLCQVLNEEDAAKLKGNNQTKGT